jgi:site-specific DNA-methyltransferase (adenine-specific)
MQEDYISENVKLLLGDCLKRIKELPDDSIDNIIADVPYNIKIDKWDNDFRLDLIIDDLFRVLKTNGNLLIFQGWSNVCKTKELLDKYFIIQDWIIYDRIKGRGGRKHLVSTREDILWYTKSDNYTFNKIPSTIRKKTGGLGKKNGCEFRALSNVWTDISPLVPWCVERKLYKHSAQKPYCLMERLVKVFSNENDTILDFTMGTGVTGEVSVKNKRNFIGIEKEFPTFVTAKERILKSLEG